MKNGDDFRKMVLVAVDKQQGAHVGAFLTVEFTNSTQNHEFFMWTGHVAGPGVHKLLCSVTSQERLDAHWQGFVENLEAKAAEVGTAEPDAPVVDGFDYAAQRAAIGHKLEALGFGMEYDHGAMPGEGHFLLALLDHEPVDPATSTPSVVLALAKEWSALADRCSAEEQTSSYQTLIADGRFEVVEPANAAQCIGRVLWSDGEDAVQSLGRNKVVVHDMRTWPTKLHVEEHIQTVIRGSGPVGESPTVATGIQR